MALNPLYVPLYNLQQDFLDKTTGLQLAGGKVYFWQDINRNNPKEVYILSGSPPNYTYTSIGSNVTLSNAGTIQYNGNDVVIYAYPYDMDGNADNYYVQVFAAGNPPPPAGTPILTREAVPGIIGTSSGNLGEGNEGYQNMLSNPQFVDVLFDPAYGMTVSYPSGVNDFDIAPGWGLRISAANSGTVTVTRTSVAGSSAFVTDPPYYLTITPNSNNITQLLLFQRLEHNPNIWAGTNPAGNGNYIATSMSLIPGNGTVTAYYADSAGNRTPLVTGANISGLWQTFNATTQLNQAVNPATSDTGYVEIQFQLPPTLVTSITSLQAVGLTENVMDVAFQQEPVNRQKDHLFHYYQPQLNYKPIPSHLVAWDFPLNPAQISGEVVGVFNTGNNSSNYLWDQTVLFQSVDNGVSTQRSAAGGLELTAALGGQMAIIQYLPQAEARKILNQPIAVNVAAKCTKAGGGTYTGTVSIWYTKDVNLPSVSGSNQSIVATLSATGKPATQHGTWFEVPRGNLGDARFSLAAGTGTLYNDYNFNGWNLADSALLAPDANLATYIAIVIGFAPIATADVIDFGSVGMMSGDIATRPAPQTQDEVLRECERYYEKSYQTADLAGTATLSGMLTAPATITFDAAQVNAAISVSSFGIIFKTSKLTTTPTVTVYSTDGTAANVRGNLVIGGTDHFANIPIATWTAQGNSSNAISYKSVGGGGIGPIGWAGLAYSSYINFHYVADDRLGK